MRSRQTVRSLIVISWVSFVWQVLVTALTNWKPAGLAILGWCEGIFAFGLPDFVMVETSHFSRFWWRCAVLLLLVVLTFHFRRHLSLAVRRAFAWIALFVGGITCLLIGLGCWDYLLEIEGRYETNSLAERIFGVPIRLLYVTGIAGMMGLAISITNLATHAALRRGIFALFLLSLGAAAAAVWLWRDVASGGMYSAGRTAVFVAWVASMFVERGSASQTALRKGGSSC